MLKLIVFLMMVVCLTACTSKLYQSGELWQSPTPTFAPNATKAERIVAIALREHQAWGEPFITTDGRIAQYEYYESEKSRLLDGSLAWERVVAYWRDGGALAGLDVRLPYHECNKSDASIHSKANICRAFTSDVAWSAAFISYVMKQAGVDFYTSPRHFDYIRHSWQGQGDYRTYPVSEPLALGDMLCYLRGTKSHTITNYDDLTNYIRSQNQGLPAHCDVVVRVDEHEIWLVGGNVLHTVMLRKMHAKDGVVILPKRTDGCTPYREDLCHLSQRNWVVVLKLQNPSDIF